MKTIKELENMPDELREDLMFNMTATELLLQIAEGEIDPVELAKRQLANRGLGKKGEWVGFDKAEKTWNLK